MAHKSMNRRFADFADWFSENMGDWKVTAFFLLLISAWALAGPAMHYSDAWQLWINTPTTIIELFLELSILNSSNRVERRILRTLQRIKRVVEAQDDDIDELLERSKDSVP